MQLEKCALQMDMRRTWNGESDTAKFAAALFVCEGVEISLLT